MRQRFSIGGAKTWNSILAKPPVYMLQYSPKGIQLKMANKNVANRYDKTNKIRVKIRKDI